MAEKITIVTEMVDKVTGTAKMIEKTITKFNKKITTQAKAFDISAGGQKRLAKTTKSLKDISEQYAAKQLKVSESAAALANKNKLLIDWSDKTGTSVNKLSQGLQRQGYQFNKSGELIDQAGRKVENMGKVMKKAKAASKRFRMEFLGLLFGGMAIKRIFDGIRRSTVSAFTKVMESSDMLGTNVQRLGVHWEYLKFTIGSAIDTAIGPLMPAIMNIIGIVSEWIQQHPKLAAWIIIIGGLIGSFMMTLGQFALLAGSITTIFANMGISLGAVVGGFLGLLTWAALAVGIIMILNGLLGNDEAFQEWAANAQKNGGIVTKVFLGILRILSFGGRLIRDIFLGIVDLVLLVVVTLAGAVVGIIEEIVNGAIFLINQLIRAINKIPGINIGQLSKVSFGTDAIFGFAEDIMNRGIRRQQNLMEDTPTLTNFFTGSDAGDSGGVKIEQNNNFSGIADITEMKKMLDDSNKQIMDEIKSMQ